MAEDGAIAMPPAERRLLWLLLAVFAVLDAVVIRTYIVSLDDMYPDFFGLWSYAQFIARYPAVEVYDLNKLLVFQRELAPGFTMLFGYGYPPTFLLFLAPLGYLGFGAAALAWTGTTLAGFLLATVRLLDLRGTDVARGVAVLLLMPTTMVTAVYGQSGFLISALLVGALALLPGRPFMAGLLLGLATVKPQMGLLVPVALVAGGHWRAVGGAVASAAALALASLVAYGNLWPEWLAIMPVHGALMAEMGRQLHVLMATPLAGFLLLGAPPGLAMGLHVLCGLYAVAMVWIAFRRGVTPLAVAALCAGTFLVSPYGFTYDTPMVTAAVLLLFVHRYRAGTAPAHGEIAILAFALVAPVFVLADAQLLPMVPASLLLLCGLVGWRVMGRESDPAAERFSE